MATIIWCDHVRHIVQEPRSEVDRILMAHAEAADGPTRPNDRFAYFTIDDAPNPHQRALNVNLISSFEAVPGDAI